jgi:uncharacterized protein YjdB
MLLGIVSLIIGVTLFNDSSPVVKAAGGEEGFFHYITIEDNGDEYAVITKYTGIDSTVTIPGKIDGYTVKAIDLWISGQNEFIEKFVLPKSVISVRGFYNYPNLKEINLENVSYIYEKTFYGCSKLKSVNLSNVEDIGSNAFRGCTALTEVTFGKHRINTIGESAFQECGITSVELYVNKLSYKNSYNNYSSSGRIFADCTNLKTVKLDVSEGYVGFYMFFNCSALTSVKLSDSIRSLGAGAFEDCISLKSIELPKTLEVIDADSSNGMYVFSGCTSLEEITIPSGVEWLHISTFEGCTSLKTVNLQDGLLTISSSKYGGKGNWTFNRIPNTVRSITLNEYKIANIVIPNSVRYFDQVSDAAVSYYSDSPLAEQFSKNSNATVLKPIPAKSVSITAKADTVIDDGYLKLDVKLTPENTTDAVTWISSSTNVASVNDNGEVYGNNVGQVVIRATTTSGLKSDYTVKVVKGPTTLTASSEKMILGIKETSKRIGKVNEDSFDHTIIYTSSNPSVATVSEKGVVTANKVGSTVITLSTLNGLHKTYNVTVLKEPSKITLKTLKKTIKLKDTIILSYTLPADSWSSKIVYTSSNPDIAKVDENGKVTAKKTGSVKITITTYNGKKSSITLKIVK